MTAETTLRIELLKFYDDLYHDETGLLDPSGWKCHFAKNYIQTITIEDIEWFVGTTLRKMECDSKYLTEGAIRHISAMVYNNYKYTIDDECIAFVLKSKTEMNRNDRKPTWFERLFRRKNRQFNLQLKNK